MATQRLQAVKKQDIGIGRAVNCDLEQSVLGTPVWLHENGHSEIAADAMRLIANAPEDLFMRHIHRCLWSAMGWLTENGHLPSGAMIKQAFLHQAPREWSDDSSRQDLATPGFLAELAERGNCRPYLIVGDSPLFYMRQQLSEFRIKRIAKAPSNHSSPRSGSKFRFPILAHEK